MAKTQYDVDFHHNQVLNELWHILHKDDNHNKAHASVVTLEKARKRLELMKILGESNAATKGDAVQLVNVAR